MIKSFKVKDIDNEKIYMVRPIGNLLSNECYELEDQKTGDKFKTGQLNLEIYFKMVT